MLEIRIRNPTVILACEPIAFRIWKLYEYIPTLPFCSSETFSLSRYCIIAESTSLFCKNHVITRIRGDRCSVHATIAVKIDGFETSLSTVAS
ncbi:hypothetical protein J6590_079930 [Homalodisca vitripennis]|nr:hypothetical protein J6590_079930 [Homalodisca vitripennis]